MTEQVAGVDAVSRIEVPERPLHVRRTPRRTRTAAGGLATARLLQWRGPAAGAFEWPWPRTHATAVDALGQRQPVELCEGRVRLHVSPALVFVAAKTPDLVGDGANRGDTASLPENLTPEESAIRAPRRLNRTQRIRLE